MHQLYLSTVRSAFLQKWDGPLDFLFLSGGETDDGYQNVTDKYERARRQALSGGFDYLFCIEADMIVPPDALAKLIAIDADVGYGLYCWRHGSALGMWSAYPIVENSRGYSLSHNKDEARLGPSGDRERRGPGVYLDQAARARADHVPSRAWRCHPPDPGALRLVSCRGLSEIRFLASDGLVGRLRTHSGHQPAHDRLAGRGRAGSVPH
jgi:hypothetical protein